MNEWLAEVGRYLIDVTATLIVAAGVFNIPVIGPALLIDPKIQDQRGVTSVQQDVKVLFNTEEVRYSPECPQNTNVLIREAKVAPTETVRCVNNKRDYIFHDEKVTAYFVIYGTKTDYDLSFPVGVQALVRPSGEIIRDDVGLYAIQEGLAATAQNKLSERLEIPSSVNNSRYLAPYILQSGLMTGPDENGSYCAKFIAQLPLEGELRVCHNNGTQTTVALGTVVLGASSTNPFIEAAVAKSKEPTLEQRNPVTNTFTAVILSKIGDARGPRGDQQVQYLAWVNQNSKGCLTGAVIVNQTAGASPGGIPSLAVGAEYKFFTNYHNDVNWHSTEGVLATQMTGGKGTATTTPSCPN